MKSNLDIFRVTRELLEWAIGAKLCKVLRKTAQVNTAIDATGESIKQARNQSKKHFEELETRLELLKPIYINHMMPFELDALDSNQCTVFSSFTAPVKLTFLDLKNSAHEDCGTSFHMSSSANLAPFSRLCHNHE